MDLDRAIEAVTEAIHLAVTGKSKEKCQDELCAIGDDARIAVEAAAPHLHGNMWFVATAALKRAEQAEAELRHRTGERDGARLRAERAEADLERARQDLDAIGAKWERAEAEVERLTTLLRKAILGEH